VLSDRCLSVLSCLSIGVLWQTVGWIKMQLRVMVGLGPGDSVLVGNPAPPPKRGTASPKFRPMSIFCGSTARWIKMRLGTEVGLVTGDIVIDGDSAAPAL